LGHAYAADFTLERDMEVQEVQIVSLSRQATLEVESLTLGGGPDGRSIIVALSDLEMPTYRQIADNGAVKVLENPSDLPRVWPLAAIVVLPAPAVRAPLLDGRLPDGPPFEPRQRALLEPSGHPPAAAGYARDAEAHVTGYAPGKIEIALTSDH